MARDVSHRFPHAATHIQADQRQRRSKASGVMLLCLLLAWITGLHAQAIDPMAFKNPVQEARFQHLTRQLRCMVCQNENLADSNAALADDIRHEVRHLMQQRRSDTEIKRYLARRYSNFILYDPPLQAQTWLLWFGPLLILLAGGTVLVINIRRRQRAYRHQVDAHANNGNQIEQVRFYRHHHGNSD